jgi:flavoprotein
MYRQDFQLSKTARVFRDTTASAAAVGLFYYGVYLTLIVAPATSNTVAKCVFQIRWSRTYSHKRDSAASQPSYWLATPELDTEAPKGMAKVYPRDIDLKNTERLKSFESTIVVESLEQREAALARRWRELHG